jgi:hypothetical protein
MTNDTHEDWAALVDFRKDDNILTIIITIVHALIYIQPCFYDEIRHYRNASFPFQHKSFDILKLESQQAVQTMRREFNVYLCKIPKTFVCRDIWELRKRSHLPPTTNNSYKKARTTTTTSFIYTFILHQISIRTSNNNTTSKTAMSLSCNLMDGMIFKIERERSAYIQ